MNFKALLKKNFLDDRSIIKVFFGTGAVTFIKILSAIVLSKIVATKLGRPGLALLGQLTSFVTIALLLSTGGVTNGIIKYVAEKKNKADIFSFIGQSFKFVLISSFFTGLVLLFAAPLSSVICFNSADYSFIFRLLGITLVFYAFSTYFNAFLNGMSDFKTLNQINILNNVFGVLLSVFLITFFGLFGAFLAVALNQTVTCIILIFFIKKYSRYFKRFWTFKIKKSFIKNILSFSAMALVTAMLGPTSQIYLRALIIKTLNLNAAGEWEAVNRISSIYISLLLNVMIVYYLPKLSEIESKNLIRVEIRKGYLLFLPVILFIGLLLLLFKHQFISMFLSSDFIGVEKLFLPQLVGDIFKVMSFLYAYLVIAKKITIFFIVTEILGVAMYLILARIFIPIWGISGLLYAYALNYFLYFLIQFFFIGQVYLNENSNTNFRLR